MKRIDKFKKQLVAIEIEIAALASFRKTPQLNKFIRQLHGELSYIRSKLKDAESSRKSDERAQSVKQGQANKKRSEKNKRTWRYVRAIRDNYYPDKTLKEIRALLRRAKEGLETEVPDVAWRNPSP